MRQRTRRYTNDYPCLNLTALIKKGYFSHRRKGESSSSVNGHKLWAFGWLVMTESIHVAYSMGGKDYKHEVSINKESVNLGGFRYYMKCPYCDKNRKQLYLIDGNAGCRECFKLHYKCQSETKHERQYRKIDRLSEKVRMFGGPFDYFVKTKWKHYSKFEKVRDEMEEARQFALMEQCRILGIPSADSFYDII